MNHHYIYKYPVSYKSG